MSKNQNSEIGSQLVGKDYEIYSLKEKLKEAKEIIGYFVDNSPTSIIRFSEFEKRAEKFIEDLKVDQGE